MNPILQVARRLLVLTAALGWGIAVGEAQVVTESFKNSAAAGWVFSGTGYTANLTSGGVDASGDGWLRLTSTGPTRSAAPTTTRPSPPRTRRCMRLSTT